MKSQLADFISLLYPRTCYTCDKSLTSAEKFLCLGCELNLPKWETSANKAELLKKFAHQPKVTESFALMSYMKSGMAQQLIQGIKYKGKKDLGIWLGEKLGLQLQKTIIKPFDLIIPVPLHRSRQKQRGYNQSDLIARGISTVMDVDMSTTAVARVKKTNTQTKKAKTDRWTSMDEVFEVINANELDGKVILIVDDVITTGATTGRLCDQIAKTDAQELIIAALAAGK